MNIAIRNVAAWLGGIGLSLAAGEVCAKMSVEEKEHVQSLVVLVEFAAFATAVGIAVFVWRLSKRDGRNNRNKKDRKPD